MKILWLTWKDRSHPLAGGAEVVNEELAKRLVKDGHEVLFLTGGFPGGLARVSRDGFDIIRLGGRYSVYWHAYRYYKRNLAAWPDLVIDEMNTIPFFARYYVKQRNIMFVHQLCREIWFYQMPFPLSLAGYFLEPLYLRLLNDREVITVSESTKRDLVCYGFNPLKVHIISEGVEIESLATLADVEKFPQPTILALGAIRPMKRTMDTLRAFEVLKKTVPDARLIIAGASEGAYGERVFSTAKLSPYVRDIECLGGVSNEHKLELLRRSHILSVTSVKEGWCLVVTEANSQGTPAVVYDADGLRDSVRDGETGRVVAENSPEALALAMSGLLSDHAFYEQLRMDGWKWSKEIAFDKSYRDFVSFLHHV